jgi:tetratricopeptide (TPR) repeat protein
LDAWEAALKDTNVALALDPTYTKAQHRRATALNALGQKAAALADLEAVAVSLPNNTQVNDELASLRAQLSACTTPVNRPSRSARGAATPAKAAAKKPPTPSQQRVRLPITEEDSEDGAQELSAASTSAAVATEERRRLVIEESDHRCVDAFQSGVLLALSPGTHIQASLTRQDGEAATVRARTTRSLQSGGAKRRH